VIALDLTANFYSDDFASSIAEGLTFLAENDTPYCIHCTEGKDRAGFTAMLLEALMGATLDEIIQDYMLSFENYYGINKENEPQRYQAVFNANLMEMLLHVTGAESVEQLEQIHLETAVTAYLIDAGMSQEDILLLQEKLG
jgi:protein tyrosine/serine phosphatase